MSANVNKPTDIKKKEADVNRKLQLYGIISAFQAGKVPSNDQIDVALNSFLNSKGIANPPEKLSPEGRALVADARNVVKNAQHLLLSKNQGNLLQDFIWQTEQWDAKSVNVPGAPVNKETAQQHGDQALQGLRTLGTLLITNGQFRKLLKDASVLLRDIAGDAATNAASQVRPSQEQLDDIDRPAEDNTWHDAPDFSKDNMRKQAQGLYKGDAKKDLKDVATAGNQAAHPTGSSDPNDLAQATARDQQQGTNSGVNAQAGVSNAKQTLQDKVDKNVNPETQEQIKKSKEEAMAQGGSGTVREARGGLAQAESDLRTLIERFANSTSTEDLWNSIGQIYQDADRDPELKGWFKSMNQYIRRCLLKQGYILEDASNEEWRRLYDQGRYLLREKYRSHTDRVVDEMRFIINEFDNDPQNKAFGQSIQKLFQDLGNDENGKPTFKPHLVKDLTEVIVPAIFENAAYIPVPRIEYSDPQFDAVIENLVLESDNFMPNVMEINTEHHFRWGRKKIANKNKQVFDIKVSGIQMDLRDVSYHIARKQGFPSITDTGVADFILAGDGFSFKAKCATADKSDRQNFFKIEKVDVDIKNMSIKLKQSNHKLLFNLFKPIMMKVIKPALQKAVEKSLKDQANQLDQLLYQIKQEADRALDEARSDPERTPNIYNRYYTAAQKRALQQKQKAKEIAQDKKVNVAMTKEDSIFPNINLPGGISTKATEYKELARKGDRWESPVFSIGKASKSNDIPVAPKIQRKTHGPMSPPKTSAQPTSGQGYSNGQAHGSQGYSNNQAYATGQGLGGQTYGTQGQGLDGQGYGGQGLSGSALAGQGISAQALGGQGLTGQGIIGGQSLTGDGLTSQNPNSQTVPLGHAGQESPLFTR
ncbi:1,3-beta-glucanosyltransferase gel1 [Verticillium dahliae VDG1]|nr:1,3-beta-glucanosyltransferase gel1 [Verticillium dahliae VDG1]